MMSQLCSQTIPTHIMPDILQSAANQTMKLGNLIEYTFFYKKNIYKKTPEP